MEPFPEPHRSVLVVLDLQESSVKAVPKEVVQGNMQSIRLLLEIARLYEVPRVYTEHQPQVFGGTVKEMGEALEGAARVEKTTFSAWAEPQFREEILSLGRDQVWLCGLEAHVCVLQTSIQMREAGFRMWLFADAVGSREKLQWRTALNFLEEMGVRIITSEMLAFALLKKSDTDAFGHLAPFLR